MFNWWPWISKEKHNMLMKEAYAVSVGARKMYQRLYIEEKVKREQLEELLPRRIGC